MVASSTIDATWRALVLDVSSVQIVTPKIYQYDITRDSEKELAALRYEGKINFITCLTSKTESYIGMNAISEKFTVALEVYRQKDPSGTSWAQVRDTLETIDALVKSALGNTWDGNIAFWERQKDPPAIDEIVIDSVGCWHGKFLYYAQT
jgi:hypothetical protein